MKIKKLLISCLAIAFAGHASSEGLTPKEALNRFLGGRSDVTVASKARRAKAADKLQLSYTSTLGSKNTYYVFDNKLEGGFVILSADDNMPAVLGVVDKGQFDYNNIPTNMKFYLEVLDADVRAKARKASPRKEESSGKPAIQPLLGATEWDQSEPFNCACPSYQYGQNGEETAPVGCVATAMAQVMRYWKYPAQGTGSHSYKFVWDTKAGVDKQVATDSVEFSTDFSAHEYEWDKMIDKYTNNPANYSDEQATAIATLLKDCGVAANMRYGTSAAGGSGALANVAGAGMVQYFGYDASLQWVSHLFYTDDEWQGLTYNELQNSRPVMFGGTGKTGSGGHEYVCDGYDGEGKFHINWGWSGAYNGYFVLTGAGMVPTGTGTGGAAVGNSYGYNQNALIHIMPSNNENATGKEDACRLATVGYSAKVNGMLLTLTGSFYNVSYRSHKDSLGVQLQMGEGDDKTSFNFIDKGALMLTTGQYVTSIDVEVSSALAAGEYKVVPIMKGPDEENWIEIKVLDSFKAATLTVTEGENGEKTISVTNNDAPKVEATGTVTANKSMFRPTKKKDDGTLDAETLVLTCESGIKNCDTKGHKFCFGCEFYDLTESNDEQDVYWLSTNVKTNADNLAAGASIKTISIDILPELEAGHKYVVSPIFYVEEEGEMDDDEYFDMVDEIAQYVDMGNNEAPVIEIEGEEETAIKTALTTTGKVTIYDVKGRTIVSGDIHSLPTGVYIVKDDRGVRKIVRK